MTCGDLFAGIGGISLGLERAGFTVRWQVERDRRKRACLARHWPAIERRTNIRAVRDGDLEPVDLVAGGFPCQDISAAGKGAGISGARSGLWTEFARIICDLRPRWTLVENVPPLRRRGADVVLGDLEAAGYACWPLVVGARHVGAPHRRDRVWIIGRLADVARVGERAADAQDAAVRGAGPREDSRGGSAGVADARSQPVREQSGRRSGPRGSRAAFPAAPGERQHDWEEPRTVESPLGRAAHGLSARLARARWRDELHALGDAVVPQVVEVIGRAILAAEREMASERGRSDGSQTR